MTRRKEDCEYTDRQGRTQTEILEERLRQLQNRVKELENPLYISTSILLHDPYVKLKPEKLGRDVLTRTVPPLSSRSTSHSSSSSSGSQTYHIFVRSRLAFPSDSSYGSPRIGSDRIKGTNKDHSLTSVPRMLHVDDVHGLYVFGQLQLIY